MEDPSAKTTDASAIDVTVDDMSGPTPPLVQDSSSSVTTAPAAAVALVEGSAAGLTAEIQVLLRKRLRLAAVVLFFGFAAFLAKDLFLVDYTSPRDVFVLAFHALVTGVLGTLGGVLCHRCMIPLGWLRLAEVAVFGLPMAFLLTFQYVMTVESCRKGLFNFHGEPWLLLMFTYALFIPNTLRRAAVVIAIIALAPLGALVMMIWNEPCVAQLITADDITNVVLMFLVAAVASVFGVDTIGTLRREAFEARQIGQYHLKRRIGAGGMGEVHLAEHSLMKRPCVIKLIRPDKTDDPRVLKRFQREVRATAKLSHWNTVEIFDYGVSEDGVFYYVMEYLPGMSLAELIEQHGPTPPARAIHFLRQACDALSEAHGAGLIHRDIKPGNIFAARRGGVYDVAKLLDFGLVKPSADEQQSIQLTTEGSITGSPLYMSPEQAMADSTPDARSDIYSLGAVGYFLLAGRPPFEGTRPLKVIFAHAHEEVVRPSQHVPTIPADLEAVIVRCLAKRPEERFPDTAALGAALAACRDADGWSRQDARRWWQANREDV